VQRAEQSHRYSSSEPIARTESGLAVPLVAQGVPELSASTCDEPACDEYGSDGSGSDRSGSDWSDSDWSDSDGSGFDESDFDESDFDESDFEDGSLDESGPVEEQVGPVPLTTDPSDSQPASASEAASSLTGPESLPPVLPQVGVPLSDSGLPSWSEQLAAMRQQHAQLQQAFELQREVQRRQVAERMEQMRVHFDDLLRDLEL
jgi:hypothetical protein